MKTRRPVWFLPLLHVFLVRGSLLSEGEKTREHTKLMYKLPYSIFLFYVCSFFEKNKRYEC